jgi:hypothetical protein
MAALCSFRDGMHRLNARELDLQEATPTGRKGPSARSHRLSRRALLGTLGEGLQKCSSAAAREPIIRPWRPQPSQGCSER